MAYDPENLRSWLKGAGSIYANDARRIMNESQSEEEFYQKLGAFRDAKGGSGLGVIAKSIIKPVVETGGGLARIGSKLTGSEALGGWADEAEDFSRRTTQQREDEGGWAKGLGIVGELGGNIGMALTGGGAVRGVSGAIAKQLMRQGGKGVKAATAIKSAVGLGNAAQKARKVGIGKRVAQGFVAQAPQVALQAVGRGASGAELGMDLGLEALGGVGAEALAVHRATKASQKAIAQRAKIKKWKQAKVAEEAEAKAKAEAAEAGAKTEAETVAQPPAAERKGTFGAKRDAYTPEVRSRRLAHLTKPRIMRDAETFGAKRRKLRGDDGPPNDPPGGGGGGGPTLRAEEEIITPDTPRVVDGPTRREGESFEQEAARKRAETQARGARRAQQNEARDATPSPTAQGTLPAAATATGRRVTTATRFNMWEEAASRRIAEAKKANKAADPKDVEMVQQALDRIHTATQAARKTSKGKKGKSGSRPRTTQAPTATPTGDASELLPPHLRGEALADASAEAPLPEPSKPTRRLPTKTAPEIDYGKLRSMVRRGLAGKNPEPYAFFKSVMEQVATPNGPDLVKLRALVKAGLKGPDRGKFEQFNTIMAKAQKKSGSEAKASAPRARAQAPAIPSSAADELLPPHLRGVPDPDLPPAGEGFELPEIAKPAKTSGKKGTGGKPERVEIPLTLSNNPAGKPGKKLTASTGRGGKGYLGKDGQTKAAKKELAKQKKAARDWEKNNPLDKPPVEEVAEATTPMVSQTTAEALDQILGKGAKAVDEVKVDGPNVTASVGKQGTKEAGKQAEKALEDQLARRKIGSGGEFHSTGSKVEPEEGPFVAKGYRTIGGPGTRNTDAEFFSNDPDARIVTGQVDPEDVRLENPLRVKDIAEARQAMRLPPKTSADGVIKAAGLRGYDGIVFKDQDGRFEFVRVKAAKSAEEEAAARAAKEAEKKAERDAKIARAMATQGKDARGNPLPISADPPEVAKVKEAIKKQTDRAPRTRVRKKRGMQTPPDLEDVEAAGPLTPETEAVVDLPTVKPESATEGLAKAEVPKQVTERTVFKKPLKVKYITEAQKALGLRESAQLDEVLKVARREGYDGVEIENLQGEAVRLPTKPVRLRDRKAEALKKEGMKQSSIAGIGAVGGAIAGGADDAVAQSDDEEADPYSPSATAGRVVMGAVGGAVGLTLGVSAFRALRGKVSGEIKEVVERTHQRIMEEAEDIDIRNRIMDPSQRADALESARRRRMVLDLPEERMVDPYEPLAELGGQTVRENFPVQMFSNLSAETRALLAGDMLSQLPLRSSNYVESLDEVMDAAKKQDADLILRTIGPEASSRKQNVAVANRFVKMSEEFEKLLQQRDQLGVELGNSPITSEAAVIRERLSLVEKRIRTHREDMMELSNFLAEAGTNTARDLSAFRITAIADARRPARFLKRVAEGAGRRLNEEEASKLKEYLLVGDYESAAQFGLDLQTRSWWGQFIDLVNAGRLSGFAGRTRDMVSGLTNTFAELGPNAIGRVAGDRLIGKYADTGLTTSMVPSMREFKAAFTGIEGSVDGNAKGLVKAGKEFLDEDVGLRAFREKGAQGWVDRQKQVDFKAGSGVKDFDMPRNTNVRSLIPEFVPGSKQMNSTLDVIQKSIYRITSGIDKIAKGASYAPRQIEMARIAAKEELDAGILKEADLEKRIREIAANPTQEMMDEAKLFAERNTFQNQELAAGLVHKIKTEWLSSAERKNPAAQYAVAAMGHALEFLVPFARTGANISARVMDYTMIGGLVRAGLLGHSLKRGIQNGTLTMAEIASSQRDAAEAVGRAFTGGALGLAGLGYSLYNKGMITGQMPRDPSERQAWDAAGIRPNSINVAGQWVPVGQYSAWGNALVLGATMAQALDQGELDEPSVEQLFALLVEQQKAGIRSVLDQPLVTGPRQILDALAQDDKASSLMSNMIGGMVPTISSDIAAISDDGRQRMIDRSSWIAGTGQRMMSRIPGLRQQLPLEYDVLGNEVRYRSGSPLSLISPFSGGSSDKMRSREAQALLSARGGVGKAKRLENETLEQYSQRLREVGTATREAIREQLGGQVPKPRNVEEQDALREWLQDRSRLARRRVKAAKIRRERGL